MIRTYFKIAFRNLVKNKLYSSINIVGLTTALAACLLIGVYINHELSYDRFNTKADRIVRVTMEYKQGETVNMVASTGTKVGPQFKRSFPAVEEYVRTFISHNTIKAGDRLFDEPRILYADPAFFKIFSFKMVEGDPATALDAPDKIVLTRSMAKKYFGESKALEQTLTSGGKELKVSGVCEDAPQNSQVKFDFVTQFLNLGNGVKDETWWTANWITYLLLRDRQSIPVVQRQVEEYMKSADVRKEARLEGSNYLTYHLEPLTSVHLRSKLAGFEPNGSITYIFMFAAIAILILIIACANYTNLATAQSVGRSGEIGVRKVMGASRGQVFFQFIGESAVFTFLSAVLAVVLGILLIPYFNMVTGRTFTGESLLQPFPVVSLIVFAVAVSFFAGIYPALVLSGTKLIGILKKGFRFTGGNSALRKGLIIAQFGISVFLIIYTTVLLQQLKYMQTKNLGYDKEHVLVLPIGGKMLTDFGNLKNAFARVPGVEGITAAYETPEFVQWGDGITAEDEKGKHEVSVNAMPVDLDFVKTLKMQLITGRDFTESDFASLDTSDNYRNYHTPYIINESLAKKIGWTPEEAIGRTIDKGSSGPIVGVVRDFNFSSLREPIGPMVIFLGRDYSRAFMLRINGKEVQSTLARLEATWRDRIQDRPFAYHFLDENYNKLYKAEQRTSVLFSVAAGLAILLACLGLFGLAAFSTVQRTKEIGIRRVLGANLGSITLLVAKSFLQLIAIAILVAIPAAWWAGNQWLKDFAFRIHIEFTVFAAAAALTILIALATIAFHTVKAGLTNPVKALRTE